MLLNSNKLLFDYTTRCWILEKLELGKNNLGIIDG